MWNIRSHARRFPVHTGTLTPSIAHPNRFLNHLKRFSAGFLTFRGGKIKKHMVLGAESTIWNARREAGQPSQSSPVGLASSPKGRALGMTAKFPGKPQSPPYRKGRLPSQSRLTPCQLPLLSLRDIFPRSGGSLSSQGGAFGHLPVSANKAPPSGELAATSGSRLRGSAPAPRELAKPSGFD